MRPTGCLRWWIGLQAVTPVLQMEFERTDYEVQKLTARLGKDVPKREWRDVSTVREQPQEIANGSPPI